MNKTLNINLGGIAFIIDEDAYKYLDEYLTAIHNHFKNAEGYEEITNDIEARMGELFLDQLHGRTIINTKDVQSAKDIMGSLEDFGAEPAGNTTGTSYTYHSSYKTGRRMFRDTDDKILGGVCSGLAAYFGINDPLWIRIIFALLFFTFGTGFLLYLLLWIIVPKAVTTTDKLAMRGESINVSNIAKEVQDGMKTFGDKIHEIGQEIGGQKKNRFATVGGGSHSGRFANFLNELLDALKFIIPKIFKYAIILFAILVCFIFVIVGVVLFTKSVMTGNYLDYIVGRDVVSSHWFFFTSLALCFILPAVLLLTWAIKLIFRLKSTTNVMQGVGLLWFIAIVFTIGSGFNVAHKFQHYSEKTNAKQYFSSVVVDTLTIDAESEREYDDFDFDGVQFGDLKIRNNILYTDEIRAKVVKSDKPGIYWEIENSSNGISQEEANELAGAVSYEIKQDGKRLIMPRYFAIPKGKVWRNQKVKVTFYVPEGKYLKVTDRAERFVRRMEMNNSDDDYGDFSNHIWKMGKEGFINTTPNKEEDKEEKKEDAVTRDSTQI